MKTGLKVTIVALLVAAGLAAAFETSRKTVTKGLGYFPVAIGLKNGDLLAVIRGGAAHIGVKGRLDLVRSSDGGQTWSAPWTVVDGPLDDRNPALGQSRDGTIVLAYVIASNYDETGLHFKGARADRVFDGVYVMHSRDNGRTWSKPVRDPTIRKFYEGTGARFSLWQDRPVAGRHAVDGGLLRLLRFPRKRKPSLPFERRREELGRAGSPRLPLQRNRAHSSA